eukprot:CAMPEP_0115206006 /NCGR_PEP_ID=MMETSP0270-20121206/19980_1 /TAXON_ID=71861 /ORGANISM="Scrippsiella trochoidea, Strain CCMP3099" /LENGTH=83 /DNA_ID=CAMNT_0002619559 /DNA_START=282 /DNA_END=534 /DNA_ORIENTATION=-
MRPEPRFTRPVRAVAARAAPGNEELVEVEAGAEGLVNGVEDDAYGQCPEEEGGYRQVPCQAVCVHEEVQRPAAHPKPPEVLPL